MGGDPNYVSKSWDDPPNRICDFFHPNFFGHLQVDPGTQNTEPVEPTPDDSIRNQVRGVVRR